jgi:arylsulfatase A-like enzyme
LPPDEPAYCTVESRRGSRLHFALATRGTPDEGSAALEVLLDRQPALLRRFKLRRKPHVWKLQVPVDREGPVELGFRVRLEDPHGLPLPPAWPPRVSLGSPRLYLPERLARRNVLIWISQDSLRADHLGAYGYSRATSPVFDRLARSGVLFENAVSVAPWTLPSLASQFTSRHPSFHGLSALGRLRDASQPTLFSALAQAGFTVLGVTGNRFVSEEFGTAAGFDALWYAESPADQLNQLALQSLSEWPGGHLALFIHHIDPHFPYEPPASHDRFDPGYRGSVDGRNFESVRPGQQRDLAHVEALYDGEVAFNDEQIGRLLAALGERGLVERALLVYSSDHGEEFLDHGGWTHSRSLYQELLHVPLLIRLPRAPARRVAEPVSLVDLAPTVLEFFGVPPPPSFQGQSLLALAQGQAAEPRDVFAETTLGLDKRHRLAVRRGPLKTILVMPRAPAEARVLSEERFDLAADPGERRPLPPSPAHDALRGAGLSFMAQARGTKAPPELLPLSPETLEKLRALGYVE